jgi:hypothetical protein
MPPNLTDLGGTTDIHFYIDGTEENTFGRTASGSDYEYDVLVYSNHLLSLDSHEIRIVNGQQTDKFLCSFLTG